jgi:hypothetical protein
MLPSPSEGPPLLSLSWSPAVGPWGILEEPDCEDADVDVGAVADDVSDEVVDEEEVPPHPATASASATSAALINFHVRFLFMSIWILRIRRCRAECSIGV